MDKLVSHYRQQLIDWLKDRDLTSENVLSIGCEKDDRKYFHSFNCNVYKKLDINNIFDPDIVEDINVNLEQVISQTKERFDDIFSFEIWEYIWNVPQALKNINLLLKNGGLVWISAPSIYPVHTIGKDYSRYTEFFWQKILPHFGFNIIEHKRRSWKNSDGFFQSVKDDGMFLDKKYTYQETTGNMIIARKIKELKFDMFKI